MIWVTGWPVNFLQHHAHMHFGKKRKMIKKHTPHVPRAAKGIVITYPAQKCTNGDLKLAQTTKLQHVHNYGQTHEQHVTIAKSAKKKYLLHPNMQTTSHKPRKYLIMSKQKKKRTATMQNSFNQHKFDTCRIRQNCGYQN